MSDNPPLRDPALAQAERELAQTRAQVDAMRAVLAGLLQDVMQAEVALGRNQAIQLVEANEQLVVAALAAQTEADTAATALDDATRTARLDPLTDLPNRLLLLDRLTHAMATAKRNGTRSALLFIDIDRFKEINDTLGHAVGDQVLRRTAQCLSACVRAADSVSRHGGDEFLILLAEVSQAADAAVVAEKVIAALAVPHRFGEHELRLKASIGISIYPDDADEAGALIERADAAMYVAKRHGLGGFEFHGENPPGDRRLQVPSLESQERSTRDGLTLATYERRQALMQEANEQLVVAALSAQDLHASAESAQRRQAVFLAGVATELRNPLAPIRAATAMLGRLRTDEPLLPRAQAIIERQVGKMWRLVDDILEVTRGRADNVTRPLLAVDVTGLIEDAVEAGRVEMDHRGQVFDVEMAAGPITVSADPRRLELAVTNLLANASQCTPDGGHIALTALCDGNSVVITVTDTGSGIDAETVPSVFDALGQDSHALGLDGDALGTGLSVVREIAEAHGGSVVASSAGHGRGSQFVLKLPLLQPPAARAN